MTDKRYCHEIAGIIDLYIHDELDSYGKEKFEEHISKCGECKLLLDSEISVVRAVRGFGGETPDIASAVMSRIIDDKLTVAKPKRRWSFTPSLVPAAVAVIAVTIFSRTNIMNMLEKDFDPATGADEAYNIQAYYGETELKADFTESTVEKESFEEAEESVIPYVQEDENNAGNAGDAALFSGFTDGGISAKEAIPEQRSVLLAPPENKAVETVTETDVSIDIENEIQALTDEYNEDIFNELKGKLNPSDGEGEDEINTLIVLNSADEQLLAELLQDIEYEQVNGIIMADISSFTRFRQNSDDNDYDDFKIYQENEESTILAFTFGE